MARTQWLGCYEVANWTFNPKQLSRIFCTFPHFPRRGEGLLRVLTSTRVRTGGVQGNQIHSSTLWILGMGFQKCNFYSILRSSKFYSKQPSYPAFLVLKFGRSRNWIKVTFLESPGSIEYCYVFGFLGPHKSLPWVRLKYAVASRRHSSAIFHGSYEYLSSLSPWWLLRCARLFWEGQICSSRKCYCFWRRPEAITKLGNHAWRFSEN